MNIKLSKFLRSSLVFASGGGSLSSPADTSTEQLVDTLRNLIQSIPQQTTQSQQVFGQQLVIAGLTVLGGFLVYVAGQIFTKFFIEPFHEQKRTIGKIADAIIFYANKYYYPLGYPTFDALNREEREKNKSELISNAIRKLGTQLISKTHMIPCYKLFVCLHISRPMTNIIKAKRALVGLSNLVGSPDRKAQIKFEKEIREALNIFDPEKITPLKRK